MAHSRSIQSVTVGKAQPREREAAGPVPSVSAAKRAEDWHSAHSPFYSVQGPRAEDGAAHNGGGRLPTSIQSR